ncbi:hypothetical protein TrRE_jg6030 [Triparma retinervis]|uniref:Uncharacterized protein n=1 Tax=Triparma retinervis TaxID=2557542 RepID=A0A9W7FAU3_9STRA|nr:hypothetical protein TrRE_jg6030 [Triparma retinervis]
MSRISTPKSGTRNHQEPPPADVFNPAKFLHSNGLDRHICEMFQTLLHHRPADPLFFIHEYLKALARAEDEQFQKLQMTSSAMNTPRVSKKKKDREQAPPMVVAKREAGRENVSDVDIMELRLELERLNDDELSGIGGGNTDRLHELLSGAFLSMARADGESKAGAGGTQGGGEHNGEYNGSNLMSPIHVNTIPLTKGSALLRSLGEEINLPRRALDNLLRELEREGRGEGAKGERITFGQFCGAGRSLAMLPRFLEEAEKLCSKLNGRPSPMKHQLKFEDVGAENSGRLSPQSTIMDALVDTETLLGALPIGTGDRTAEGGAAVGMAWSEGTNKNVQEVPSGQVSLRDSLLAVLGEKETTKIGVFDLVSATLNSPI